jgi:uncharacterized membrane protein YedE/YeeE
MSRSKAAPLTALASGFIFGFGLAFAGMTDPQKVKDFLDLAAIPGGGWDPSLALVLASAVIVAFIGFRLDRRLRAPFAAPAFVYADRARIDRPLLAGAVLFGIGWGLSGFCPGPAIADLGIVPGRVLLFVAAMFAGSWITGEVMEWLEPDAPPLETADPAE